MNTNHDTLPQSASTANRSKLTELLETFPWAQHTGIDKQLIVGMADSATSPGAKIGIFYGPPGSGKLALANALAAAAQEAGHSVNLVSGGRLDARFVWPWTLEQYMVDCNLLLVDEPLPSVHLRALLKARKGRSTILIITGASPSALMEALLPLDASLDEVREGWITPIVVDFK